MRNRAILCMYNTTCHNYQIGFMFHVIESLQIGDSIALSVTFRNWLWMQHKLLIYNKLSYLLFHFWNWLIDLCTYILLCLWISVCHLFKRKIKNQIKKKVIQQEWVQIWLTCSLYNWRFLCWRINDACDELKTLILTKSARLWIIHGFVSQWLAYLAPRCTWFWNWHCCSCSICCWFLIQKHVAWGNIFSQSLADLFL